MICNLRNEGREVEKIVHIFNIFIFSIVSFCVIYLISQLQEQGLPAIVALSTDELPQNWLAGTSQGFIMYPRSTPHHSPPHTPTPNHPTHPPRGRGGLLINNFVPATNFSGNDYPQLIYWIPMTGNPDSLEGIIIIIRRRDILLLELAQRSSSNSSPKIIPKYT